MIRVLPFSLTKLENFVDWESASGLQFDPWLRAFRGGSGSLQQLPAATSGIGWTGVLFETGAKFSLLHFLDVVFQVLLLGKEKGRRKLKLHPRDKCDKCLLQTARRSLRSS